MNEMGNKNSLTVGEIQKIIEWLSMIQFATMDTDEEKELEYLIKRLEEQQIQ